MIYGLCIVLIIIGATQAMMIYVLVRVNDNLLGINNELRAAIDRSSCVLIQQHATIERLLDERRSLFQAANEGAKSDKATTQTSHATSALTIEGTADPA